jgi:ABC-type nitrate/sulfonate/bicarbonate transport system substrate-binding protein
MMKRLFLSLVSLMLTLQWFVIGTAAAKTINVAYPSPSWNTSLPVSMAQEFGLFAAEGLEVQPVYVRGGPVVMAALLGGDADFAVIAGVTSGDQYSATSRYCDCRRPYGLHRSSFNWSQRRYPIK